MRDDLVTVATCPHALQAHTAKNFLEENGICAFLADENFANLNYPTLISIKLQVATVDAERAKSLLAAHAHDRWLDLHVHGPHDARHDQRHSDIHALLRS